MTQESTYSKRSNTLAALGRKVLSVLLGAVGLTLALVALAVGVLNIASARQMLLDVALDAINAGEMQFAVSDIGGTWPNELRLRDLAIADTDGVWLTLDEADLDWRPLALWSGELHITGLDLRRLSMVRAPESEETSTPTQGLAVPKIPTLPFALRFDRFAIDTAEIGAALIGEDVVFDATGNLVYSRSTTNITLDASRRGSTPGEAELVLRYDAGPERGRLTSSVTDGAPGLPGIAARLLNVDGVDVVTFDASGQSLAGLMTGVAILDAGRAAHIEISSHGAMSERVNLDVKLAARGTLVARELKDLGGATDIRASGKLTQTGSESYRLSSIEIEAGALALTGGATLEGRSGNRYGIEAEGTFAGLDQLLDFEQGTFGQLGWRATGEAAGDASEIVITEAAIDATFAEARFNGAAEIDTESGALRIQGDGDATISDLMPLGNAIGQPMRGTAEMKISSLSFVNNAGSGDVTLTTSAIEAEDANLTRLFSRGISGSASFRIGDGSVVSVPNLSLAAGERLQLAGNFALDADNHIAGKANLKIAEISDLLADGSMTGALDARATMQGRLGGAEATLNATLTKGTLAGIDAREATLDATLRQGGTGALAFRLNGADGRARLNSRVTLPEAGGARFDAIEADMLGATLGGAVAISPDGLATGEVSARRMALAPLGKIAGIDMDGRATVALKLEAPAGRQDATFSLESRRIDIALGETVTLDRVTMNARLTDLNSAGTLNAAFAADGGAAGNTRFTDIKATARGPLDAIAFDLAIAGERLTMKAEPVSLALEGNYNGDALTLDTLRLVLGRASGTLAEPFRVTMRENRINAPRLTFDFDGPSGAGSMVATLMLEARAAKATLETRKMPLELLTPLLPLEDATGTMSGTASLDTRKEQGSVRLRFDGVTLADAEDEEQPAFAAEIDGAWTQRRLTVAAKAHGVSEEPFVLNANLPLIRDPQGAWPTLPARGPISGSLTWHGPIASLMALVDQPGQRLTGDAQIGLTASGDISAPVFSGRASLKDGTFENFATGTVLRKLELLAEAERSETLKFTLSANDSGQGRISGEGILSLAANASPAVRVNTVFANMQVARRRDLQLSVDGNLDLEGDALPPDEDKPLKLGGRLTTTTARFNIPERLPGGVAHIDVVEVRGDEDIGELLLEEDRPFPLALDIALAIGTPPAQVTGRGVNALWDGDVTVTGSAENPVVKGTLTSLRGTLDFAGKTFVLSRGRIVFDGSTPPDPSIDIALDYSRRDFEATVHVSGRGSAPQIRLSSEPSLPKDEIISHILFEKGVGELSAIEAAQLANTAAQLSGAGFGASGGFGLLNDIQQSLGLDVLRVDQGSSGGTTLSAGKYLREGVYVGVEQGALASDSSVKVEIDLTDNISVDTKLGQDASGNVGVNWKWDY